MPLPALAIPALIGAGASVVGNVAGAISNSNTNRTNFRIAQMNNEFNERMLQKQMDYNTEMWNKENEYNTAANQVQRLRDAGLNPYLMMNGGNAGMASSAGGVTPPSASPVTMRPNTFDFSGIGNVVQSYMQLNEQKRVNDALIDQVSADAELKRMNVMTSLMDSISNNKNKDAQSLLFKAQEKEVTKMLGPKYERELNAIQKDKVEIRNDVINGLLLSKELSIFDEKTRIELSEAIQRIAYHAALTGKTEKEASHEVQKELQTKASTSGIKITNEVARRTAEAVIERAIQATLPAIGKYGENTGDWTNSRKYGHYK